MQVLHHFTKAYFGKKDRPANLFLVFLFCLLPAFAIAQSNYSMVLFDANGDGNPPTELCSSYNGGNISGSNTFTIADAITINSITVKMYYTSCNSGQTFSVLLNGTQIGSIANPDPQSDCSCNPPANKWPLQFTISNTAQLNALFNFGAANTLTINVNGHVYVSFYGATVQYATTLYPVISPSNPQINLGEAISFSGAQSYSTGAPIVSYAWDFGDGTTATGVTADHTYAKTGIYTATLTIQDNAGLSASMATTATVDGPPQVICVPWRHKLAHETWNDKSAKLKAVVKSLTLPLSYTWNFGDGSTATGTITTADQAYKVEANHTYPNSSDGTPYTAVLSVTDAAGRTGSDRYDIVVRNKTLDVEVNVSIDDGLWALHKAQARSTADGKNFGKWEEGDYSVSPTASTVMAFEIQGHRISGNPDENPYVETVSRGLNHIFSKLFTRSVAEDGNCPLGNPDQNGNGLGIDVNSGRNTYEIGMAMMAIALSGTPDLAAEVGASGIINSTYKNILTDMVDMVTYGQNPDGGWIYSWNGGGSDNSVTQWPAIGMEGAQANYDIVAPAFVKSELAKWLANTQNANGAFGYTSNSVWLNPAKTGGGIASLNYLGVKSNDQRVINAISYLNSMWGTTGYDGIWGNCYAMYGVMKGLRTTDPQITFVGTHDWYAEMARYLVDQQNTLGTGLWPNGTGYSSSYPMLNSAWSILILSPTVATLPPVADLKPNPMSVGVNTPITFDASGSYHLDNQRTIVKYDFDFGDGTTYSEAAGNAPDGTFDGITTHTYAITVAELSGLAGQKKDYIARVTVTDDDPAMPRTDNTSKTVTVSLGNHPPVANAGGPYTGYAGLSVALSGASSYDPDQGEPLNDEIAAYGWELAGVPPYDFDDAATAAATFTWATAGTYNIGLKVSDKFGLTHTAWTTVEILPGMPTVLSVQDKSVNYSDPVTLTALLLTASSGVAVEGKIVNFSADFDGDGTQESIGSAVTDASGIASLVIDATMAPNSYQITASFAQAEPYLPSSGAGTLTVSKEPTVISYTGDVSGYFNADAAVKAVLKDDEGNVIATLPVSFLLGTQSGAAITDGSGEAAAIITISQTPGVVSVAAEFGGNGFYNPSSDSKNFTIINRAPVANAGADQNIPISEGCAAAVQLDGSASTDQDNDQLQYTWVWSGGTAVGATPTVTLPIGTHQITLTVSDGRGGSSSDEVVVTIRDVAAPVADVATLPTLEGECGVTVSANPTATDNCAGTVTGTTTDPLSYMAQGTYTITWIYSDGNGNTSTQPQTVVVKDNTAPVADVATLPTLEGECGVTVSANPTATDNCAGTVTGTTTDPLTYSAQGTYTITWTYSDGNGNTSTQPQTVVVKDNTAPVADVATLVTITGECSAAIPAAPTATDNCSGTITGTTTDALSYTSQGTYTVTWTYDDGNGNVTTQQQVVIVKDLTTPVITSVTPNPSVLWPPNHKMWPITLAVNASDNCTGSSNLSYQIVSVTSNEKINGIGDGNTAPDWLITGDRTLQLRAERSGPANGRIYTITVQCTDAAGLSTTAVTTVTVPHDQRKK